MTIDDELIKVEYFFKNFLLYIIFHIYIYIYERLLNKVLILFRMLWIMF